MPTSNHDGAAHFCARICRLDGGRVCDAAIGQFVIGEGSGMHITMNGIPPAWLVVEIVDGDTAMRGVSELVDEILHPVAGPRCVYGCAGIGGCNSGDITAAGGGAAAHALRIGAVSARAAVRIKRDLVRVGGFREAA
jgi:hypothetical protein